MVLPEGAPSPDHGRPARWKLGGVVAALALTTGLALALLEATAPSPEVAATTTEKTTTTQPLHRPTTSTTTTTIDVANFRVSAIATGERLNWYRAPTFVTGWPIDVVTHEGHLWLFTATASRGPYWGGAGLSAWVSSDGIDWRPAGVVAGEEFSISHVEVANGRLIAVGSRLSDGAPHVWISGDGAEWRESRLPVDLGQQPPGYRAWFGGAAAAGDNLYVVGFVEPDWQSEIYERLPGGVAENLVYEYGLGYTDLGDGDKSIEVYGPLGLVAYSATLSELGIDRESAARIFDGSHANTSFLWSSPDGVTWSEAKFESMWAQELAALPDGTLFINGGDPRGAGIWTSADGSHWERAALSTYSRLVGTWSEDLLMVSDDDAIQRSADGQTWESLGTDELLPSSLHWDLSPVASGEAGLAVVATTWPRNFARLQAVTVEEGGNTLTFDPRDGSVTVSDGEVTVRVPTWRRATDLIQVDFATERVTFSQAESGEAVATFTFAALRRAETAALGQPHPGERALLLTESGSDWSIIDIGEEIGSQSQIHLMEIFGDRLVLVTTNTFRLPAEYPVRFSVMVADLP